MVGVYEFSDKETSSNFPRILLWTRDRNSLESQKNYMAPYRVFIAATQQHKVTTTRKLISKN